MFNGHHYHSLALCVSLDATSICSVSQSDEVISSFVDNRPLAGISSPWNHMGRSLKHKVGSKMTNWWNIRRVQHHTNSAELMVIWQNPDKSKGVRFLVKGVNDAPLLDDVNTMFNRNGNALFHAMTIIPSNFQLISHWIFDNMPKKFNFNLFTDIHQGDPSRILKVRYGVQWEIDHRWSVD